VLSQIDTFVSVSGGSILNGALAMASSQLQTHDGVFQNFEDLVARPTREFCKQDLRTKVLLWDRVNPVDWPSLVGDRGTATDLLAYVQGCTPAQRSGIFPDRSRCSIRRLGCSSCPPGMEPRRRSAGGKPRRTPIRGSFAAPKGMLAGRVTSSAGRR
jgi:hypothetical protein